MNLNERIESQKERLGIWEYAFLPTKEIPFSDEVRRICEKNACGMYGTNWACPPAVGSAEACRAKCMQWDNALVITTKTILESRYDVSLWKNAAKAHESGTDDVLALVRGAYPDAYALSTEGCSICATCTFSLVARMARPVSVLERKKFTKSINKAAIPNAIMRGVIIVRGPNAMEEFFSSVSTDTGFALQITCAMFCKKYERPTVSKI